MPHTMPNLSRRAFGRLALASSAAAFGGALGSGYARAATPKGEPIKVGILHSLSGTMAISETTLKDVMLMLIAEQNRKGGLLGRPLEPVVVDPASNWPLFAEKARQLLSVDKASAVFGCWTSVSRKSVLPVFEELNGILFYPVQYEGQECSRNIFYTGAAPNQQAIPAVDYLLSEDGGGAKRFALVGTDYIYPRTTNQILVSYLKSKGIADEDIMVNYTPFGQSDWQTIVSQIKAFGAAGKKTAVVSTINGDANVPFIKSWVTKVFLQPTCRLWPLAWVRKNWQVWTPNHWLASLRHGTTLKALIPQQMLRLLNNGTLIQSSLNAPLTTLWKPTILALTCGCRL